MNRRGTSTAALAIAAAAVLVVVAVVAFAAGAAVGGHERYAMPGVMGRGSFDGIGRFGGFGWFFGGLLLVLLVVAAVWAVVALLRPDESHAPRQVPPQAPAPPAAGSAEAFEAWHRQAHATDETGAPRPATPAPSEAEPPPGGGAAS